MLFIKLILLVLNNIMISSITIFILNLIEYVRHVE